MQKAFDNGCGFHTKNIIATLYFVPRTFLIFSRQFYNSLVSLFSLLSLHKSIWPLFNVMLIRLSSYSMLIYTTHNVLLLSLLPDCCATTTTTMTHIRKEKKKRNKRGHSHPFENGGTKVPLRAAFITIQLSSISICYLAITLKQQRYSAISLLFR